MHGRVLLLYYFVSIVGLLSYPRTETEIFPPSMDLSALVREQVGNPQWGGFATQILANGVNPRNGSKTDEAHPPIHPTKGVGGANLTQDEAKIYELATRHFLACCSQDAQAQETTVEIEIETEKFKATGRMVTDRGYLDVYPYENWAGSNIPGNKCNTLVNLLAPANRHFSFSLSLCVFLSLSLSDMITLLH